MIEIPLTKGYVAVVDDEDADLAKFRWHADINRSGVIYARRNQSYRGTWTIHRMHRVILGRMLGRSLLRGELCDHKDRNGVNNKRSNLRLATYVTNAHNMVSMSTNKSGVIGVSWSKEHHKWHARMRVDGKDMHLGFFDDIEMAVQVRQATEIEYRGEFVPDRVAMPLRSGR